VRHQPQPFVKSDAYYLPCNNFAMGGRDPGEWVRDLDLELVVSSCLCTWCMHIELPLANCKRKLPRLWHANQQYIIVSAGAPLLPSLSPPAEAVSFPLFYAKRRLKWHAKNSQRLSVSQKAKAKCCITVKFPLGFYSFTRFFPTFHFCCLLVSD